MIWSNDCAGIFEIISHWFRSFSFADSEQLVAKQLASLLYSAPVTAL